MALISMDARFDGRCTLCPSPIRVGDSIIYDPDGYGVAHAECHEQTAGSRPEPEAAVCMRCFLEKPCPCEDGQ